MAMIRLAYPDLEFKEVAAALKQVINSGWLTKGPKVKELEERLCAYLDVKYAVAVSSGTAALHLALLSLDISSQDEVIVPDFTFPATANVVELCGARAVLADIELNNFNIDPVEVQRRITARTRAIMPVHQFGTPVQMGEILKIAKQYNLYVIEDAACALGARYRTKMCGTMGDLGCFSFHPRKIITAGEGGAVVTNSLPLAKRLRLLREHGMQDSGAKRNFTLLGLNYRISEIASVLGLAQLKKIERIIEKRARLNDLFGKFIGPLEALSQVPGILDQGSRLTHQAFIAKINRKVDIFKLITFLKDRGIESTISNTAVHMQPYYQKKYAYKKGQFKNSCFAFKNSLALPFHCRLQEKHLRKISTALAEYLGDGSVK